MEKAMLTFDKVNAHYGKIQALHDVSLHINQGEIVTLIGANGAGKTTLLGTLCGDPRATSGRIVFDGKDITDWQTAKIMREAVKSRCSATTRSNRRLSPPSSVKCACRLAVPSLSTPPKP
jgi:ABC-type branched-subunit amino acid transport system ATPase component